VQPHRSSATNQQSTKYKVFPVLQFKKQKKKKTKNHLEQKKVLEKDTKMGRDSIQGILTEGEGLVRLTSFCTN